MSLGSAAIPITRLGPGLREHGEAIAAAVARVLASGVFIGGPEVQALERELAAYLGVACVGVNSGTDALVIALRCLGLQPGDEVLVPAFGFVASAEAVSLAGGVPVFVDIEPPGFAIDPAALAPALTARTRGLVVVHPFGQAAAMDELGAFATQHGLWLLEDVAQALGGRHRGRPLGSLGRAAAFSFFPTKNLGACGDAGMIACADESLAERARRLRQHGAERKYASLELGYNSRLDALQAAILRAKLPGLERSLAGRRQAAARYDELLADVPLVLPRRDPHAEHTFHQYTVRIDPSRRDAVQQRLLERGIETVVHYPTPLHFLPVFAQHSPSRLPAAEAACRSVLSLPLWPEIERAEQEQVARALRDALA